jgi:large subunit ribosomal protein L9
MKIILVEEVESLGDIGDLVEVAAGYGRNYLLPRGLAIQATQKNLKTIEHERRLQADRLQKAKGAAQEFAQQLEKLSLQISKKVGEGERLYGSVTSQDIAEAAAEEGVTLNRRKIILKEPIRSLGVFQVPIKIHPEVQATLKVGVVRETSPEASEGEEAPAEPEASEAPPEDRRQKR